MIFGKLCCLRKPEREDFAKIWTWWNSEETINWTSEYCFPKEFDSVEKWSRESLSNPSKFAFVIHTFDKESAGLIELYNIDWRCGYGCVEFYIGEKARSTVEYGKDALMTLLEFAFKEVNLRRIEGKISGYNKLALETYKACGFKKEGRLRKKILWQNTYYDEYIMGLLKEEYIKKAM